MPGLAGHTRGLVYRVGNANLVDKIDLDLPSRSLTVVLGPNGAGKSLLLRLMHGLLRPTAGQVLWGGRPLDEELRKRQAMVFQRPVLLRRSVAANIQFVLRLRGAAMSERTREILEEVGLEHHGADGHLDLSHGTLLFLLRHVAVDGPGHCRCARPVPMASRRSSSPASGGSGSRRRTGRRRQTTRWARSAERPRRSRFP